MISNYLDTFGKENVLVLSHEEILSDPKKEMQVLFNFLEIDSNFVPSNIHKKTSPSIIPRFQILEDLRVKLFVLFHRYFPFGITFIRRYRIAEVYRTFNDSNKQLKFSSQSLELLNRYYKEDQKKVFNLLIEDDE